jgi:hypothetical protein
MIAEVIAFFALWSVGFWLLLGIASVLFMVACEKDLLPLSIITTLILVGIYHAPIAAIVANPVILLIGFVVWTVAGVIWSVWRWSRYVVKTIKEAHGGDVKYQLQLSRNKTRIINWIVYWPWSLIWNITGDFFTGIYEAMEGVYQKILDRALEKAGLNKVPTTAQEESFVSRRNH